VANQRIPSLDGLRAISILMVITGHIAQNNGLWHPLTSLATAGVNVFFVISGFLITTLLLREQEQSQMISLKNFYVRRTLRIFPLAYAYIGCVLLLNRMGQIPLLGDIPLNGGDAFYASTYLMAYHQTHASWPLAHMWSLSLEEQFYLLWPLALVLVRNHACYIAMVICVAMPLIRTALWFQYHDRPDVMNLLLPHSVDAIALGCCAAYFPETASKIGRRVPTWAILLLPLCAWAILAFPSEELPNMLRKIYRFSQDSACQISIVVMLVGATSMDLKSPAGMLLNSRAMILIGVLSYSLYIWQELFLMNLSIPVFYGIPLTCLCAWAGHQWIENPFLRLKDRFHR